MAAVEGDSQIQALGGEEIALFNIRIHLEVIRVGISRFQSIIHTPARLATGRFIALSLRGHCPDLEGKVLQLVHMLVKLLHAINAHNQLKAPWGGSQLLQKVAVLVLFFLLDAVWDEVDVGELGVVPGLVDYGVAGGGLDNKFVMHAGLQVVSLAVEQLEESGAVLMDGLEKRKSPIFTHQTHSSHQNRDLALRELGDLRVFREYGVQDFEHPLARLQVASLEMGQAS